MCKIKIFSLILISLLSSDLLANVHVNLSLKANVIVSEQGTEVSQSGGVRCNHGGGGTKRRTINNSWFQTMSLKTVLKGKSFKYSKNSHLNLELHKNEYNRALHNMPPKPGEGIYPYAGVSSGSKKNLSGKDQKELKKAIAAWEAEKRKRIEEYKHDTNSFRTVTFSGGIADGQDGAQALSLNLKDVISADVSNNWNSKCWRAENNAYRHGSNTIDGSLHINYKMPKGSQFLKLAVDKADGLFSEMYLEKIDGSLIPSIGLSKNQYVWVVNKGDASKVKIRFKYSAYPVNASGKGDIHKSTLKVKFHPLQPADPKKSFADRLQFVTEKLEEGNSTEDELIPEIAPLIEKGGELAKVLRSFSLKDIRYLQDLFLEYSLTVTQEGAKNKSPFVKAMVAVVSTKISEDLSKKLLPVCVIESVKLPVLQKNVQAQRYVFMMFYLGRMKDRLESYKPLNTFQIVKVMADQEKKGLTYKQVSETPAENELLKKSYGIFLEVAQIQQQPVRISTGEFQDLSRTASAFVSSAIEYSPLLEALNETQTLERKIYKQLRAHKKAFTNNPSDKVVNVSELEADVLALDRQVKDIYENLEKMTKNHLFQEVSVGGFGETMIRIFEGLNLVSGDQILGADVRDYYTPIFHHFFNPKELADLSNKAQLCLSGKLESY